MSLVKNWLGQGSAETLIKRAADSLIIQNILNAYLVINENLYQS